MQEESAGASGTLALSLPIKPNYGYTDKPVLNTSNFCVLDEVLMDIFLLAGGQLTFPLCDPPFKSGFCCKGFLFVPETLCGCQRVGSSVWE